MKLVWTAKASPFGRGGIAAGDDGEGARRQPERTPSVLPLRVKPASPRGWLFAVAANFSAVPKVPP